MLYHMQKISSSGTAKSRRDEAKRMSDLDSVVKKNMENDHTHHLCISKFNFVTQCNHCNVCSMLHFKLLATDVAKSTKNETFENWM